MCACPSCTLRSILERHKRQPARLAVACTSVLDAAINSSVLAFRVCVYTLVSHTVHTHQAPGRGGVDKVLALHHKRAQDRHAAAAFHFGRVCLPNRGRRCPISVKCVGPGQCCRLSTRTRSMVPVSVVVRVKTLHAVCGGRWVLSKCAVPQSVAFGQSQVGSLDYGRVSTSTVVLID